MSLALPLRLDRPTGRVLAAPETLDAWTLFEPLGRGSYCDIRRARHAWSGRSAAVKVLRSCFRDRSGLRDRFLQECRITARLDHPHVPRVWESGVDAQLGPWLALEQLEGESLSDILLRVARGQGGGWTLRRLLGVWREAAAAVQYAHEVGVLHRDLKPANVFVDRIGRAYLVDWGLAGDGGAFDRQERWQTGQPFGTLGFLSPEQARGAVDLWDPRIDVWGLGAVLYTILTQRRPYEGDDVVSVLTAMRSAPPVAEQGWRGESVPAYLAWICRRAMALDPDLRYPSVQALDEDVARWLDGRAP